MRSSRLLIVILVMLALTGCGGGSGGSSAPTLVSIAVTPASTAVAIGQTQQFAAVGTFSDKSTQDISSKVTWTSSNLAVAAIGATTGLATTSTSGQTTITATLGNVFGTTKLTVTLATVVSISVTPSSPSVAIGTTQQFIATGIHPDNTTEDLTTLSVWSSSITRVVTINAAGLATPHAAGTSTTTAILGGLSGSTTLTVPVPSGGNSLTVTVNGSLCSSGSYPNKPCVSVTICSPGTSTCQTITDILLDTGSYGLRLFKQVVTVPLPQVTVASGNLAECVKFGDGSSLWGPVQTADVILGGEPAVSVPIQVVNAAFPVSGAFPTSCGTPDATPAAAGFNGILGAGLFAEDCGTGCSTSPNNTFYFACTGTTCSGSAAPLASQVQNPVAHLPADTNGGPDNNGVLVQLPAISTGGALSVNGQLLLGIGTRANNTPSGVTAYPANLSGDFTTVFNGSTLSNSFIDSGSNGLFFSAPASLLPPCDSPNQAWYCPSATVNLSATNRGTGGTPSGTVDFQIGNALGLFNSGNRAFAELGGVLPPLLSGFDWGLPFFYGRSVFVGIDGRSATGLGTGPYWAY
jgi:Protein of unknown function (DUF3443)/Bacterial Ig-like domain (group 2)